MELKKLKKKKSWTSAKKKANFKKTEHKCEEMQVRYMLIQLGV